MSGHVPDGSIKPGLRANVSDGTEQADDCIEFPVQFKIHHIPFMKAEVGVFPASHGHYVTVEVETLDQVVLGEMTRMMACPTADVEQCIAAGLQVFLNESVGFIRLFEVILP